jgi:hypothetical protein
MIIVIRLLILLWIYLLVTVFTGCGSAEAIKGYRYQTKKIDLQKAVIKVFKTESKHLCGYFRIKD